VDEKPLIEVNKLKNQRLVSKQSSNWMFDSLKPEFPNLLEKQMATANFGKRLIRAMFTYLLYSHTPVEAIRLQLPSMAVSSLIS
jgi:hypothetical protein